MTMNEIKRMMDNEVNEAMAQIEKCKAQRMRTTTLRNLKSAFNTMDRLKSAGYKVTRTTYYKELIVQW